MNPETPDFECTDTVTAAQLGELLECMAGKAEDAAPNLWEMCDDACMRLADMGIVPSGLRLKVAISFEKA